MCFVDTHLRFTQPAHQQWAREYQSIAADPRIACPFPAVLSLLFPCSVLSLLVIDGRQSEASMLSCRSKVSELGARRASDNPRKNDLS